MVEYVKLMERKRLKTFITETKVLGYDKNLKFANFLSQQPNIGMFVPAVFEDGEWRVLTEPKDYYYFKNSIVNKLDYKPKKALYYNWHQYENAIKNIVFEGWFLIGNNEVSDNNFSILFDKENKALLSRVLGDHLSFCGTIKNLEKLTPYNLTLTPKFAKELGLI